MNKIGEYSYPSIGTFLDAMTISKKAIENFGGIIPIPDAAKVLGYKIVGKTNISGTVYKRFNDWSSKGKLMTLFETLVQAPGLEWVFIEGSIVRAHQHSAGAAGEANQAIGKSRGGKTTKIPMAVDAYGLPIEFLITGGAVHDSKAAAELIDTLPASDYMIADKA